MSAPPIRIRRLAPLLVVFAALFGVCGTTPARAQPNLDDARAFRATDFVLGAEYDKARAELAKADPNNPNVALAKARLALYEEDCDLAVALTSRPDVGQEDGKVVADVARGCARVTAATVVDRDEANGVVVRWHDEEDRALFPLVVESVVKARAALTRDLGVEWKLPTRITFVRDLLSLSAMTALPYKSAQTTGTVAVAKWGRVTILSPRASRHGYPWRDTLTHELTHLAISMQTRERAPLWLHEGVARREETRWREPGPFDDKPSVDSVVLRGIEMKLDLPLDKLGPSIAMLPSADAAMVAFAEVTSFVRYFVETQPEGSLAKLLVALRSAGGADEALRQVSGETLAQWDVRWRAQLGKKGREPLSPMYGLGALPQGFGDARERARLAELLFGRDHATAALTEFDKIPETMLGDPSLRYERARILERLDPPADILTKRPLDLAAALVDDPKAWTANFGPCWAVRGRLAALRHDDGLVEPSFAAAVAQDPFSVETACRSADPANPSPSVAANSLGGAPLCDAARRRGEPDLGRD